MAKRPQPSTIPPPSLSHQVLFDQVRSALERRRAGQRITTSEIAAIRRYERQRATQQRQAAYHAVPQTELVPMLATTRKTLLEWETAGMPVDRDNGPISYDLYKVLPWIRSRSVGETGGGDVSKRAAEIKLLVRREAALQLKMQIMSGELVHRDDVQAASVAKIRMVKAGLEALRHALAPAVLELDDHATLDQASALIWDYVEPLLNAFAGRAKNWIDSNGQKWVRIGFPAPAESKDTKGGQADGDKDAAASVRVDACPRVQPPPPAG